MADRNYLNQPQSDADSAAALKHVETVNVAVGADSRVGPYYPGNAKSVFIVATGTAEIQLRGGGSPGPANTVYRNARMQYAEIQLPTATFCGVIHADVMPHEFFIFDTSESTNPVTIYFNY